MENIELALYPFVSEASRYVGSLGFSPDRLITSRALESARIRGTDRVIQSIAGNIERPSFIASDEGKVLTELLSYPFARILVSCINDQYLTRRYALAEAKASYELLKKENVDFLCGLGEDFSITATTDDTHLNLHFNDYLKLASPLKELEWKLVNRRMEHGHVCIAKENYARLLQEAIRNRILNGLPINIPPHMCEQCEDKLTVIRDILQKQKDDYDIGEFREVDNELFPPCIIHAIGNVRNGINLAHSMRFAMTSFLITVGMSVNEIVDLFNVSPDFDEEKTRYQIEHIAGSSGNQYTPPSCSTMKTYGNCQGADELCKRIKHPLNYYRIKIRNKKRDEPKQTVKKDAGGPHQLR